MFRTLFFLSFFLATAILGAQNFTFSFEALGGYDFYLSESAEATSEFRSLTTRQLNDGSIERAQSVISNTQRWTLDPVPGADLRFRVDFSTGTGLRITTGLGLSYRRAQYVQEAGRFDIEQLMIIDTLPPPPPLPAPVNGICDRFVSEGEADIQTELSSWNLRIPLGISYRLGNIPLEASLQGYLSTPLFTAREFFSTTLRQETIGDEFVCTQTRGRTTDRSGQTFNNAVFGMVGSVSYRLSERWSLLTEVDRQVSNTHNHPTTTSPNFNLRPTITPISARLGIRYHFLSGQP